MRRNLSAYKAKFNGAYVFLGFFFFSNLSDSWFDFCIYPVTLWDFFLLYVLLTRRERKNFFKA